MKKKWVDLKTNTFNAKDLGKEAIYRYRKVLKAIHASELNDADMNAVEGRSPFNRVNSARQGKIDE